MSLGREGEGSQFPRMTPLYDVEAYLEAFERTAMSARWDLSTWEMQIGPLFIGPMQAAYLALTRTEAQDYGKVKEAIQYHLKISLETYC